MSGRVHEDPQPLWSEAASRGPQESVDWLPW